MPGAEWNSGRPRAEVDSINILEISKSWTVGPSNYEPEGPGKVSEYSNRHAIVEATVFLEGREASREIARAHSRSGPAACETAIQVLPDGDGSYLVDWGAAEGQGTCGVRVRLKDGGSPVQPESWQTSAFEPSALAE